MLLLGRLNRYLQLLSSPWWDQGGAARGLRQPNHNLLLLLLLLLLPWTMDRMSQQGPLTWHPHPFTEPQQLHGASSACNC